MCELATFWKEIEHGTCMTHPAIAGSPKSRIMNAITLPAATTTYTCAMILAAVRTTPSMQNERHTRNT
jgi:hypothetical protein